MKERLGPRRHTFKRLSVNNNFILEIGLPVRNILLIKAFAAKRLPHALNFKYYVKIMYSSVDYNLPMIRITAFYKISCPSWPEVLQQSFRAAVQTSTLGDKRTAVKQFEQLFNFCATLGLRTPLDFYVMVCHNCGHLYQELKDYTSAQRYYEVALNCWDNFPTLLAYATLKEDQGRLIEARADCYEYTRRAGTGDPCTRVVCGRGAGLNNLGIMSYNQKEYKAALVCFEQAKRLDPEEASYYNNSAIVLFDQGANYQAAREHLNIAIMNGFATAEQYYRRGVCLLAEHSFIEARDDFRKALKISPSHPTASKMLAATNNALHRRPAARAA